MLKMICGFLAILAVLFYLVCGVVFIYAMTKWDKEIKKGCDESQCDTCPFPCEKHSNNTHKL